MFSLSQKLKLKYSVPLSNVTLVDLYLIMSTYLTVCKYTKYQLYVGIWITFLERLGETMTVVCMYHCSS